MAKDRLDSNFWGLSAVAKDRVSDGRRSDLAYGVVVTLREINGVNRTATRIVLIEKESYENRNAFVRRL